MHYLITGALPLGLVATDHQRDVVVFTKFFRDVLAKHMYVSPVIVPRRIVHPEAVTSVLVDRV